MASLRNQPWEQLQAGDCGTGSRYFPTPTGNGLDGRSGRRGMTGRKSSIGRGTDVRLGDDGGKAGGWRLDGACDPGITRDQRTVAKLGDEAMMRGILRILVQQMMKLR